MPALPLSPEQLEDATRLKAVYTAKKRQLHLTQESLASACGWESQGTVSQYLNGKIPLNLEAALKFAAALHVQVGDFSPRIAAALPPGLSPAPEGRGPKHPNGPAQVEPSNVSAGAALSPALSDLLESARPLSEADVKLLAQMARRIGGAGIGDKTRRLINSGGQDAGLEGLFTTQDMKQKNKTPT